MQTAFKFFDTVSINPKVRVVKLENSLGIERYKDDLKLLVEFAEDYYPGIGGWYEKKVLPGLQEKERFAYIVYDEETPVGSAIIKKNDTAKLCSLRIDSDYRMDGLGSLLLSLLGREVRTFAGEVYFTAPAQVYEDNRPFFNKLGFIFLGKAHKQYRLFDDEVACSVDSITLWRNILANLPDLFERFTLVGNPKHPDIVISIKPEYAGKIKRKEKKVEVRRRFNKKWKGAYAMLYSSGTDQQFFGEAKISDVNEGSPSEIWKLYHSDIGVEKEDFDIYCKGVDKISALVLSEINIYKGGIFRKQVEQLLDKEITPPQSYCRVKEGTNWPTAVMLSHLLLA